MPKKLSMADFEQIVRNTPLVAIDLVVRSRDGRLLLGRRNNEPAKDWFFVPGGRIFKGERIEDAFSRIVEDELGIKRGINEAHSLGVHQHFYQTNALGIQGFGTHYIVMAYELRLESGLRELPQGQHCEYRWMTWEEAGAHAEVHPNSKAYLDLLRAP